MEAHETTEAYKDARRKALAEFHVEFFELLRERTGGNMSEAARLAGQDLANFRRLLKRYGFQWRTE